MSWFPAGEYSIIPWGGRIFTVTNQLRRSSMRIKREKNAGKTRELLRSREKKKIWFHRSSRAGEPRD